MCKFFKFKPFFFFTIKWYYKALVLHTLKLLTSKLDRMFLSAFQKRF